MLAARGRLLHAALGFASLRVAPQHPALATPHGWLDSWRGVGDIVVGMHRQGYDVQMTQYDERGWRATFYVTGMEQRDEHDGVRVRGDAVEGGAAGWVGGAHAAAPRPLKLRPRLFVTLTLGAWPTWLALGFLLAVLGAVLLRWWLGTDTSAAVRYVGTLLQVFGLALVAFGLRQTRKLFPGRSSVGERVRGWFRQLLSAFRQPTPITLTCTAGGIGIVRGKLTLKGVPADAPLDRRLPALIANVEEMEKELRGDINELSKLHSVEDGMRREAAESRRVSERTTRLIEDVAIGGLNLEVVGVLWLLVGVVAQGCPEEIARGLRLLWP